MTNSAIADNFSLLSKLMDIHGENSFKSKSYSIAAFTIENLSEELSTFPKENIFKLKNIGDSVAKKIIEQLENNSLQVLESLITETPVGIIEMLQHIKGLGPKKISTIWKEMGIESIGELLYACNENRLTLYKGFGEKSQLSIKNSIEFYYSTFGNYLYAQIEPYAIAFDRMLQTQFKDYKFSLTGLFKRQEYIVDKLQWVTTISKEVISNFLLKNNYSIEQEDENSIAFKGNENVLLVFYLTDETNFYKKIFQYNSAESFYKKWIDKFKLEELTELNSEDEIFTKNNLSFIPPYRRNVENDLDTLIKNKFNKSIEVSEIKSIIHSHSKWSDGTNTLEEMAIAAKEKGYEYLVISDHSKTAFYAQGLNIERVLAQHEEIEKLNKKLFPFKIFKSIESDILNDGDLDYEEDVLKTFDIIIASIHSNLSMLEEKAMARLITAIENPYTSILGHLTGRLLLSRNGYPINHEKIIDTCAANNVVIELNAHPRRLDIDWKWINKALEKNVLISINPDAHSIEGFDDCRYGVLVAQKTMLNKERNLSSFSLQQFEAFILEQQQKRL